MKYCDNPPPLNDGNLCVCERGPSEIHCNEKRAKTQRSCNEHPCPGINVMTNFLKFRIMKCLRTQTELYAIFIQLMAIGMKT